MKIAIIYPVPFLDSVPIVQSLAMKLATDGNLVDVFVVQSDGTNNPPLIDHENIKIYQCERKTLFDNNSIVNLIPKNILFYFWIKKIINSGGYEHVIGVDPSGLAVAGLVCLRKNIKYSYLSLELILWIDKNRMFRGYKLLESYFIKRTYSVIIQDEMRLNLLKDEYNLIRTQFDLFPNSPIGKAQITKSYCLHDKLNLQYNIPIILYMGSWSDEFNKKWLIDLANKDIGNAIIVVQCRSKVDLTDEINQEKIKFFDSPLKYSELSNIISSASIGLAFYDPEVSPNIKYVGKSSGKLTHYLFHGIPVICNSLPYWSESIAKYRSGLCADGPDELYSAVNEIILNKSEFSHGATVHFNNDLQIQTKILHFK